MTMTRTSITELADDLCHGLGNSDTLEDTYDDVLERLARTTVPFVNTEAYTPTDGTAEYSYPSTAVTILAAFHGAKHLLPAGSHELEAYDEDWRATADTTGTPVAASYYERDARKIRLFPTPDTTTVDGGTFLFSENRTTDIPEWLVLVIVFEIMAEEFSYPSDHQDLELAAMCGKVAELLHAFTGV